jgi:hypothetical protein
VCAQKGAEACRMGAVRMHLRGWVCLSGAYVLSHQGRTYRHRLNIPTQIDVDVNTSYAATSPIPKLEAPRF